MMMKQFLFSVFFLYLSIPFSFSQVEIYTSANDLTAANILVQNYFASNGIIVTGSTYTGHPASLGLFTNADPNVGIDHGISLSTGYVGDVFGMGCGDGNTSISSCNNAGNSGTASSSTSGGSDPDLALINGVAINDAAIIEIEFIPQGDIIEFNYIFASEEYESYTCSSFNDGFGLFISGPGISGPYSNNAENIALIPGTNTPVSINTLNAGIASGSAANCDLSNSQFFVDNINAGIGMEMNGLTVPLMATTSVIPGQTYILKIAIGDGGDNILDSSILLKMNSFQCPNVNPDQVSVSFSNLSGHINEACNSIDVSLSIPNPLSIPMDIPFSITGNAALDVDFSMSANSISIPAGSTSTTFSIQGIEDQIVEGDENFQIILEADPSNPQVIAFSISEDQLIDLFEYDDIITNCGEDSTRLLLSNTPAAVGSPQIFTNNANLPITSGEISYIPLDVSGLSNNTIQPSTSVSIFINTESTYIYDLAAWLISPDGKIIHLTSYNGATNFPEALGAYNFHFNKYAVNSITEITPPFIFESEPKTWLPEDDLNSLDDSPSNGTWTLAITDISPGFQPLINSWSISFEENPYHAYYNWSPTTGMDCSNCAEPIVEVAGNQTYYVTISDTHGCEKTDSVLVTSGTQIDLAVIDSSTIVDESCNGESGSISLFISGDYESLTWNTGQDSTFIDNLSAGTYTVTIENACDQDIVASYIIEPGLEYELTGTDASCGGTGSATITSTEVYDIVWSNGATGDFVDNLAPGIYYATISNTNCTSVGTIGIVESSGCTPDISGTVFFETLDPDCLADSATIPYQYAMLSLTGNGNTEYTFTNPDGAYLFSDQNVGNYDVILESFDPGNIILCPTSDTIPVDIPMLGNDYPDNDYWLASASTVADLAVNITSFISPRPAEINTVAINCYNNGGTAATGNTLVFQHPAEQTFVDVTSPHPFSYDPVTFEVTVSLPDLAPGGHTAVIIDFDTPVSAALGDFYIYNAGVSTASNENILDNNNDDLLVVVVNSFDPNDKQVSPAGIGETGGIRPEETSLTYKINFQNEGTANALQVILKDEMDTDVLDFTSIRFIESSHSFTADVEGNNTLVITYEDINLVPKSVSETESQGYIIFEIKLKEGLPLGTEIKNDAEIFFDTNAAIITNETLNTIEDPTIAVDNIWLESIAIYPNPASDKLFIISKQLEIKSVRIIDGLGKIILADNHFFSEQHLDLTRLNRGIYFVQIRTKDGKVAVRKLTVIR